MIDLDEMFQLICMVSTLLRVSLRDNSFWYSQDNWDPDVSRNADVGSSV